jgi:hypothetical protein
MVKAVVADVPAAPSSSPTVVISETGLEHIRVSFAAFDATSATETGGSTIISY